MQGGEIDLLGGDEVVVGFCADVFDVVDNEGVAKGVLGEEDDLCAASCEGADCGFAYATGAALDGSDLGPALLVARFIPLP